MREHAPRSTRLTGAVSAAALTLAMGYVLATGMGVNFSHLAPDPITYVALADEPKTEPPPTTAEQLDTSDATTLFAPPIPLDIATFEIERTIIGDSNPPPPPVKPGGTETGAGTPPPPIPVRVSAKLIPGDPPPYPPTALRARKEGNSALSVCVDRTGRVSSASLTGSAGFDALDQAALKWVRNARFKPATTDGVAQPVCGNSVTYEWHLKDAR